MSWQRLWCMGLCAAYYFLLVFSYGLIESDVFSYMGFNYSPPSLLVRALAAVMAILPSCWLATSTSKPSQVCMWGLYLMVVMPCMFVPYHVLDMPEWHVMRLPLTILGAFVLLILAERLPKARLPKANYDPQMVFAGIQVAVVALTLTVIVIGGVSSLNLSLEDVYARRFEARETATGGSLFGYALATLTYAVAPIVLLLGLARRNYPAIAAAVFAFLIVFSFRATKTDLFMPVFLLGVYWLLSRRQFPFGPVVAGAACLMIVLSLLEFTVFEGYSISDMLVRRQVMVPGLLTSYYWDFFSDHELIYYSDRFYGQYFVERRYDLPLPRLIGYEYFGSAEMNANTCYFASAFANMGYLGVFLVSGVLALVLRLLNSIAESGNQAVTAAIAALFALQLTNGALETCIITGGIAVSVAILYFLRTQGTAPRAQRSRGAVPGPTRGSAQSLLGPQVAMPKVT